MAENQRENVESLTESHTPDGETEGKNVILGKYEVGRLLGRGSFAKVYLGRKIMTGEVVAIKIIKKESVTKNERAKQQLKREIAVMRVVRHPNVAELKEVMATKQKIYFVMEYIPGGDLFEKIFKKGRLRENAARKYFQQLIAAVDFCHSRGIAHRDLKPENLLIDGDKNLKITDFGLSALPENLRIDGMLHTQCGSPAYVAPEVLRGMGYDGSKADLWSCGVILFVLLAGFLPFMDLNLTKMYNKILNGNFKYPTWFSKESRQLIGKLLVSDPNRRASVPDIKNSAWFVKGLPKQITTSVQNENINHGLESNQIPRFYSAFDLVSSMFSCFNLSNLLEEKKKLLFPAKCSAKSTMEKLNDLAKNMNNFNVVASTGYTLTMQGVSEGRKGKLSVKAEVCEVAAEVAVIEFSKDSGDTLEYQQFCDDMVRPALKDIVWSN